MMADDSQTLVLLVNSTFLTEADPAFLVRLTQFSLYRAQCLLIKFDGVVITLPSENSFCIINHEG